MVKQDRGRYVAAALTILRAYIAAGRPEQPKPLGSFEAWSGLVRGALLWLATPDPMRTMDVVRESDPKLQQLIAVMEQWSEVIGDKRSTVKEVIDFAVGQPGGEFREALLAVAGERGAIDGRKLGKYLGMNKGRIVGAFKFEPGIMKRGNGTLIFPRCTGRQHRRHPSRAPARACGG